MQTKPEVLYIAGADPAFRLHTNKNVVSDPASGVEPYPLGGAQMAGQTHNRSRWIPFTRRGKRRVWPRIWGSTPQSDYRVNTVYVTDKSSNNVL